MYLIGSSQFMLAIFPDYFLMSCTCLARLLIFKLFRKLRHPELARDPPYLTRCHIQEILRAKKRAQDDVPRLNCHLTLNG